MPKKKILFVITQSEFGGAQHYVFEIARSLNPAVYDVAVAAGPEGDNATGLLAQLQKIGVKTLHLKFLKRAINPVFDLLAIFELRRLVKAEKPDVLFLNSTKAGFLGSFAASFLKRKTTDINGKTQKDFRGNPSDIRAIPSMKIIYRIGGWAFNEDLPNWKKKFYFFLEKYTAPRKNLIIVNSSADRNIAIRLGVAPPEKIVTIYNGLDWQNIKFLERNEARFSLQMIIPSEIAKHQLSDWWISRKIIGTVANLYKTKGIRYFIKAAALVRKIFPEAMFFVIGEGKERKILEMLAWQNHLHDSFFIFGNMPSARLYLKAFDIFVLPSIKEGLPWVILEAMAAEVPIAATSVGGVPEMISSENPKSPSANSGRNGILVPPKDPKALADAIVYLMKNPAEAQAMTATAKQILTAKFSFPEMVKKTEATLNL